MNFPSSDFLVFTFLLHNDLSYQFLYFSCLLHSFLFSAIKNEFICSIVMYNVAGAKDGGKRGEVWRKEELPSFHHHAWLISDLKIYLQAFSFSRMGPGCYSTLKNYSVLAPFLTLFISLLLFSFLFPAVKIYFTCSHNFPFHFHRRSPPPLEMCARKKRKNNFLFLSYKTFFPLFFPI